MTQRRHPAHGDLYTPMTPEVVKLFERMRAEHGTWRHICAISGTRMKVLRNLRTGKRKAISQKLLDRIITSTGVGALHEFVWFTADDLVALGIWDPVQYVEGTKRIKGDHVHFGKKKKPLKKTSKHHKGAAKNRQTQDWPRSL